MIERLRFALSRLRERLWIRPLAMCLLSIAAAFLAGAADGFDRPDVVPRVSTETVEILLQILSASMLVIATFAVGSMVSSYASASSTATPRAFALVIADDMSQNALSSFVGAFIFSIVALVALKNGFYGTFGRFALFLLTLLVFAVVILTFVRWVDCIARLGRLGSTITRVEEATRSAMIQRRRASILGGIEIEDRHGQGQSVFAEDVGYVQRIDVAKLQGYAEELGATIAVAALPGAFATPDRAMAHVTIDSGGPKAIDTSRIASAFRIGKDRTFEEDPRFGLVVLAEIAGRALSPAVNDPGTAIDIIGSFVRLFTLWNAPAKPDEDGAGSTAGVHDRVAVPRLAVGDMFDDAFTAIGRDGAGAVEVAVWLQKALSSLASSGDDAMGTAARRHARMALERARLALQLPEDVTAVERASAGPGEPRKAGVPEAPPVD